MITIKHTIFINAVPTKVWSIFSNLENWPKLNDIYRYVKPLSKEQWKVGSKFEFLSDYKSFKTKSVVKILNCNPAKEVTWIGTKPFIKGKHSLYFRKLKKGTLVTNYEEFTGIGLPIIYILNLKPKIDNSLKLFLEGLKRESEK